MYKLKNNIIIEISNIGYHINEEEKSLKDFIE